jgi:hypothetical protein
MEAILGFDWIGLMKTCSEMEPMAIVKAMGTVIKPSTCSDVLGYPTGFV